jgi:hypothetical protein
MNRRGNACPGSLSGRTFGPRLPALFASALFMPGMLSGPAVVAQTGSARSRTGPQADPLLRAVIGRNSERWRWRKAPRPLPATLAADWAKVAKHQTPGLAWYTVRRQGNTAKVSVSGFSRNSMHYDWYIVHLARRNGRWVQTRKEEDPL